MNNSKTDEVQQLIHKGFKLIPLEDGGKKPRIKDWTHKSSNDPKQIEKWTAQWPHANIGIVTGSPSKVFVLDVDDDRGRESLAKLEERYGKLPATLTAKTGKGEHHYFRFPAHSIRNSQSKLGLGLDVRGDGGFAVAPPSTHPNGHSYEWLEPTAEIANAPNWFLERLTTEHLHPTSIPQGKRTDSLYAEACQLFRDGLERDTVLATLQAVNQSKCQPPLPDEKITAIVERIAESHRPAARVSAKNPLRWFPVDVPEFFSNVNIQTLTDYQLGWRTKLIAIAWMNGGRLQNDPVKLAKLANASSPAKFKRELFTALFDFTETTENGKPALVNDEMIAEYGAKLAGWHQKREAGKARANKTKEIAA